MFHWSWSNTQRSQLSKDWNKKDQCGIRRFLTCSSNWHLNVWRKDNATTCIYIFALHVCYYTIRTLSCIFFCTIFFCFLLCAPYVHSSSMYCTVYRWLTIKVCLILSFLILQQTKVKLINIYSIKEKSHMLDPFRWEFPEDKKVLKSASHYCSCPQHWHIFTTLKKLS